MTLNKTTLFEDLLCRLGNISFQVEAFVFVPFLRYIFLKSSFRFTATLRVTYSRFTYTLCSGTTYPTATFIASPIIHLPNQSCSFVTLDELPLTHRNHPRNVVSIMVHSWWCTFFRFGHMCNKYPSLWYHTEYFHCPKIPLCFPYSFLPLPQYLIFFYYLHSFVFSRI